MSLSSHSKIGLGISAIVAVGISGYLIFSEKQINEERISQLQRNTPITLNTSNTPDSSNSPDSSNTLAITNTPNTLKESESLSKNSKMVSNTETVLVPKQPDCLTFHFEPQNKDLSQFPRHVLKIPEQTIDAPASVCIRVNGTPVRYLSSKKKPKEFTIGAILAKNAKVTLRACKKGVKCAEDCAVPKDEFMEALAGEEDLSVAQAVSAGWSNNEQDKKIDRELAHFKKDLQGADESKGLFYSDWKLTEQKPACSKTIAKK